MDDFLKSLKSKEKELEAKLGKSPLFIQLESLRKTIAAFESGNGHVIEMTQNTVYAIPNTYNPEQLTWKERVMFVLQKLGEVGVAEVISEINRLEPSHPKSFLDKRVGVTISQLKQE